MLARSFKVKGLILKRANFGEADQIIHFLTLEYGNFAAVAKGVRRLRSKKMGTLEPGNLVHAFFIRTKGLPLVTQIGQRKSIDFSQLDLKQMKLLLQLLETFDKLFVEEELDRYSFQQILSLRQLVLNRAEPRSAIQTQLADLISHLGFQHPQQSHFSSLTAYIEALTETQLNSGRFLKVKVK